MKYIVLLLLLVMSGVPALADDAASKLDAVKAAYVFRISSFAVWPGNEGSAGMNLCLAGAAIDGVAQVLQEKTAGRKIKGRDIAVQYLTHYDEKALAQCDTLYLAAGASRGWFTLPDSLANRLLIISDPNLSMEGISLIRLFIKGGNIVFAVDSEMLKRSQVQLPASLLSLAQKDD